MIYRIAIAIKKFDVRSQKTSCSRQRILLELQCFWKFRKEIYSATLSRTTFGMSFWDFKAQQLLNVFWNYCPLFSQTMWVGRYGFQMNLVVVFKTTKYIPNNQIHFWRRKKQVYLGNILCAQRHSVVSFLRISIHYDESVLVCKANFFSYMRMYTLYVWKL